MLTWIVFAAAAGGSIGALVLLDRWLTARKETACDGFEIEETFEEDGYPDKGAVYNPDDDRVQAYDKFPEPRRVANE